MVAYACNPLHLRSVGQEGLVQRQARLHREFKASLKYIVRHWLEFSSEVKQWPLCMYKALVWWIPSTARREGERKNEGQEKGRREGGREQR